MEPSFYWHDYETFGAVPARDRPAQFAGIRTDMELREIGAPLVIYNQLPPDSLPEPEACLVTGLVPQSTRQKGVCEAEFIRQIRAEFMRPATCGAGYNSIRFDDEVTRFTLYRNLYDPYEREYIHQNSRWDVIDMFRLAWASRPEGVHWPVDAQGVVSFRLENLTQANGIEHAQAHDALADVRATIALVRLLRKAQPRLFDYAFQLRQKKALARQLETFGDRVFLHISALYSARTEGCIAPVMALGSPPDRPNDVILFNLRYAPDMWYGLSADELRERRLTPAADYPADWMRPPVQQLQANRCPLIAPVGVLSGQRAEALGIDWTQVEQHRAALLRQPELCQALLDSFQYPAREAQLQGASNEAVAVDTDQNLYRGGFLSKTDRQLLNHLLATPPVQWRQVQQQWFTSAASKNAELEERIFRCRARNYPDTLDAAEMARWAAFCRERLTSGRHGIPAYRDWHQQVQEALAVPERTEAQRNILQDLLAYGEELANRWQLTE